MKGVKWNVLEGTKPRWEAWWEAHFNQYPKRIFVRSTQVEDGTRLLALIVRGQNMLTVATQVQRGHVRAWARAGR